MAARSLLFLLLYIGFGAHTGVAAQDSRKGYRALLSPAFLTSGRFGLQVGLGYALSEQWVVLGEVAFPVAKNQTAMARERFFRVNGEIQRAFSNGNHYLAFQSGYVFRRFTDTAGGIFIAALGDTSGVAYSDATIRSPVLTETVKIGRKFALGERLFLDAFIGMGVRIVLTRYDARNLTPAQVGQSRDKIFPAPDPAWGCNCTLARFNPGAGIRVGFAL